MCTICGPAHIKQIVNFSQGAFGREKRNSNSSYSCYMDLVYNRLNAHTMILTWSKIIINDLSHLWSRIIAFFPFEQYCLLVINSNNVYILYLYCRYEIQYIILVVITRITNKIHDPNALTSLLIRIKWQVLEVGWKLKVKCQNICLNSIKTLIITFVTNIFI